MESRARPEGYFDVDSFFGVLSDFSDRSAALLSTAPVTVPALALFGADDPVTPFAEQCDPLRTA